MEYPRDIDVSVGELDSSSKPSIPVRRSLPYLGIARRPQTPEGQAQLQADIAAAIEQMKQDDAGKNASQLLKEPSRPSISEHEIRERAYYLWVSKGCPIDSTAMDDWLEAERVARGEDE